MTESGLQEQTLEESTPVSSEKWWTSFVLIGVICFYLLDQGVRDFYRGGPWDSANRSWIYCSIADYPKTLAKPRILIFGSSLMVAAVNDGDATTLGQEIDGTTHHRSVTLENALEKLDQPITTPETSYDLQLNRLTHSYAIGGQMASDAYAILRTLYNNKLKTVYNWFNKPRVIIWGIAPRDLMDATFSDPDISTTVAYLDNYAPDHDALGTRKPYIWRQIEYAADYLCAIYNQRQHFVLMQKQVVSWLLCTLHIIPPEDLGTVKTLQELLLIARHDLPEDNGIRQWMVKPQTQAISKFEDNSKEYQARYSPFKEKLFNQQADYLDKFLALAKTLGIKVILFNMPLTQQNMALIPAGKYDLYMQTVKTLAAKNETEFVDFNDGVQFTHEFFNDPVHLNGYGSQRFFEKVADTVHQSTQN